MKVGVVGRGVSAELTARALLEAGHRCFFIDETGADGDAARAAALTAQAPTLLLRVGGGSDADPAWQTLCTSLSDVPAFELLLADPPDPRAAPLLAPLVEGRSQATLAWARPGEAPVALCVGIRPGEDGVALVRRALDAFVAQLPDSHAPPDLQGGGSHAAPRLPESLPEALDWNAPPLRVARLVRALAGFGGAATCLAGEPVAVLGVEMAPWTGPAEAPPGCLRLDASGARVRCGAGALRVLAARAGGLVLERHGFARFCAALPHATHLGRPEAACIPFGVPELGREEEQAALRILRSRWIGTGPEVGALEAEFCEATGARHAVAVSSCTAALHLALLAAGVGPGDEVITTALTFAATVNAILYTGAHPVLVDVEPETLNLDPEQVEAAVGPRTRALLPVHFGGRPCDMARLRRIAARHGLALVEDAAHAVGARYPSGRPVGGGPAETCFSFYPNKNLTSCEGGMLTTRSTERARRYARMRMHGLTADAWRRFGKGEIVRSRVVELGFKYNLTDLQAALGRVQLARLEAWTRIRGEQAAFYREAFADLERVATLPPYREGRGRHAYHLFTLRIRGISRDHAQQELRRRGVGAAVHYEPVHLHPFFRERLGLAPGALPVAEEAGARTLTLPLGPGLGPRELERIAEAVRALEHLPRALPRLARDAGAPRPRESSGLWALRPTSPASR